MFASIRSKLAATPRWLQYTVVLVAGIASFYLAFTLGPRKKSSAANTMVATPRPARVAASAASASVPANEVPEVAPQARLAAPSRLDAGILQNPFAPLNLHASLDKPAVVAAPEPKPEKRPVPKAMAPPVVVAPPPDAPPPPPTAPPLPFVVLGAIKGQGIANGKLVVFLSEKGASLV